MSHLVEKVCLSCMRVRENWCSRHWVVFRAIYKYATAGAQWVFCPTPFLPLFHPVWAGATVSRSLCLTSLHLNLFFTVHLPAHICSSLSGGEQTGADPRVHQQGQLHAGRPGGEERCSGQRGAPLPSYRPPQAAGEVLFTVLAENAG